MWELSSWLLDSRTSRGWATRNRVPRLQHLGIKKLPEAVLVGLFVRRGATSDALEELLLRDGLQRAAVELAHQAGNCAGKLGEHGITVLAAARGSAQRTRRYLLDLAEQTILLARRFGLDLHVGVSGRGGSLPETYEQALLAAETALSRRQRVVE